MFVKVVTGSGQRWRKEEIPECKRIVVTPITNGNGKVYGRQIELCYELPLSSIIIQLPRDGEIVYLEDAAGNTTDSIKWWPPRAAKEVR